MSRTIRRKNFERERKKVEGSSINGYYTTKVFNFNGKGLNRYSYRLPTSKELWKLKRKAHGENQTSNTSFKKSERNMVEKQYRFREKRKLLNYIKGYTQDVVSEKLPKYPKYFWP